MYEYKFGHTAVGFWHGGLNAPRSGTPDYFSDPPTFHPTPAALGFHLCSTSAWILNEQLMLKVKKVPTSQSRAIGL